MIELSKCTIGIELGSTRIKATLIDDAFIPLASGSYSWSDHLEGRHWSYGMDEVVSGLASCYAGLKADFEEKYNQKLEGAAALGVSAMMHGYLAFDKDGKLLVPFRTWRNTTTKQAADRLSALFSFNIPQRWSIAHLDQAILDGEEHVKDIASLTTLAGYVHQLLGGENVLGVGDASGMFPIDSDKCDYDGAMADAYLKLTGLDIRKLFPRVLPAGAQAGSLSREGALLLDPTGDLKPGIPLAPPEGDAGTGMVATNSVAERTGNVSAGTSIFSMVVLEKLPTSVHEEIDLVTTPSGRPVAMVHCNNCTSDMNSYVSILKEAVELMGCECDLDELYRRLYALAREDEGAESAYTIYNLISGEPVVGLGDGRPVIVRRPNVKANLAGFARAHLYSALASLAHGMAILREEGVKMDRITGHGGLFRHPVTGPRFLASAVGVPVYTMKTAGEGGPYGMALLASYRAFGDGMSLEDFVSKRVFASVEAVCTQSDPATEADFAAYLDRFIGGLAVEKTVCSSFPL